MQRVRGILASGLLAVVAVCAVVPQAIAKPPGTRGPRLFPSTSIHGTRVISNCRWHRGSRSRNDEAVLVPVRIFGELH
jgi:hypothetical protein